MKVKVQPTEVAGAEWTLNHRVDLHNAIRDAALDPSGPGPVPSLLGSARVVDVDCEAGKVTLQDGRELTADVVVGADGIHSVVRTAILGEELTANPTGLSAYRCLVPKERLADIPEALEIVESPDDGFLKILITDKQERIIMYPCRNGTILNIVAVCPDGFLNEESAQSWNRPGSIAEMVDTFKSFPEWLRTVLTRADEPGLWQLRDQNPLKTWIRGRAIIIGDAAHAMLPHQGQGGAQAIEDAEALGALFEGVTGPQTTEAIHAVLKDVFEVRFERASTVQAFSRMQAMPPKEEEGGHVK
jgi:salicylate hydroxylase